jgi:hypothetical protein
MDEESERDGHRRRRALEARLFLSPRAPSARSSSAPR